MVQDESVGLGFTGGMDSTLLLYEVLLSYKHVYVLTNDYISKTPKTVAWNITKNILEEHFDMSRITHLCTTTYWVDRDKGGLEYILAKHALKYKWTKLFLGTTKLYGHYPRNNTHGQFFGETEICLPYAELYRHDIIKKFYEYDILDIMDSTNSCDTLQLVPCGVCQGCTDRKLGFKRLKLK